MAIEYGTNRHELIPSSRRVGTRGSRLATRERVAQGDRDVEDTKVNRRPGQPVWVLGRPGRHRSAGCWQRETTTEVTLPGLSSTYQVTVVVVTCLVHTHLVLRPTSDQHVTRHFSEASIERVGKLRYDLPADSLLPISVYSSLCPREHRTRPGTCSRDGRIDDRCRYIVGVATTPRFISPIIIEYLIPHIVRVLPYSAIC